jgi:fumarylpyruvate hydrolase
MAQPFVIPPGARPSLAVDLGGSSLARFPVRRIYCVGRNYEDHALEMGHDPDREPPFFFSKPADAVIDSGSTLPFPSATAMLHHEVELVVAVGRSGSDIAASAALGHVYGYGVGLDMTRRDLQQEAKRLGRPWDLGKGFDQSAPCGPLRPVDLIGHPSAGSITLEVDGDLRQHADIGDLIWSVSEVISHLSRYVRLEPGDLVMTGTPAGVGPVEPGDTLVGRIERVGLVEVTYQPRTGDVVG